MPIILSTTTFNVFFYPHEERAKIAKIYRKRSQLFTWSEINPKNKNAILSNFWLFSHGMLISLRGFQSKRRKNFNFDLIAAHLISKILSNLIIIFRKIGTPLHSLPCWRCNSKTDYCALGISKKGTTTFNSMCVPIKKLGLDINALLLSSSSRNFSSRAFKIASTCLTLLSHTYSCISWLFRIILRKMEFGFHFEYLDVANMWYESDEPWEDVQKFQ